MRDTEPTDLSGWLSDPIEPYPAFGNIAGELDAEALGTLFVEAELLSSSGKPFTAGELLDRRAALFQS